MLGHVESKGKLKEDEAKFLFHQLLVAVRYLHGRGIVHRDLKPENVLLAEEDGVKRLKIADFGFARIIEKNSIVNSVVGTPSYMGECFNSFYARHFSNRFFFFFPFFFVIKT